MAVEVHTESRGTMSRTRRKHETQSIEEAIAKSDAAFTADYLPSLYVPHSLCVNAHLKSSLPKPASSLSHPLSRLLAFFDWPYVEGTPY